MLTWAALIYTGVAIGEPAATFADLPKTTPWIGELDVETDKLIHPEKYRAEIPVSIDIKPGSFPNAINRESNGKTPVALLGSGTFDVATVNRATVKFADTPVLDIGGALEDINKDGYPDIVFHFDTQSLNLPVGTTSACLIGTASSGTKFKGCDSVKLLH